MATYTMRLEDALEAVGGSYVIDDNGNCVVTGGERLGFYNYPLHEPSHRERLTGMIFDHYRLHEIAYETVSMFAYHMRKHLNENMPLFNKLYAAEELEIDPLSTVNVNTVSSGETEATGERSTTATSDAESTSTARGVNSVFPNSAHTDSGVYATDANDSTSNSGTNTTASDETTDNTSATSVNESTTSGYQGHTVDLMNRYRESVIDVDVMVIESCSHLFFELWGNSQPYGRLRF